MAQKHLQGFPGGWGDPGESQGDQGKARGQGSFPHGYGHHGAELQKHLQGFQGSRAAGLPSEFQELQYGVYLVTPHPLSYE